MIQPNSPRAAAPTSEGLASWYTPGLVDGFGDRLLMFDNTETDSLELLRFYPSLAAIAGFEEALHDRVRQVGRLPDHAFPLIVAVERLEGDGALALVSTHTPGRRVSSFFERPGPRRGLNPAFVTGVAAQVAQALAVLQSKGEDVTHSALTPERVVVTSGGRICLVEHVLGSALRQLNLSAAQLWREFGLVAAPDPSGALRLDARTDVFQLGVLTLEMLLGRRLSPLELKDRLPDLIAQWSESARPQATADRLRRCLERALQIGSDGYATAVEAYADLRDIPSESAASAFEALPTAEVEALQKRPFQQPRLTTGLDAPMANVSAPDDLPGDGSAQPMRPALVTTDRRPEPFPTEPKAAAAGPRLIESPAPDVTPKPQGPPAAPKAAPAAGQRTAFKVPGVPPWVAALLAVVAIVEGGVIAGLLLRKPPTVPATAAAPAAPVTTTPSVDVTPTTLTTVAAAVETAGDSAAAEDPRRPDPIDVAAGNQRSGGVRLVTTIPLNVLQGDRVLGSTADGPIVATGVLTSSIWSTPSSGSAHAVRSPSARERLPR